MQAHRYREELGVPDDPDLRLRAARALAEAGARAYDELGDARSAVRLLEIAVDLAPATEEAALWDERLWNIGFVVLGRPADSRPRDLNREVYGDEVADAVAARDARLRRQFADPSTIDRVIGRPDDLRALELYRAHGARHLEPGVLLRLSRATTTRATPRRQRRGRGRRCDPPRSWAGVTSSQWAAGDLLNALFAGPSPLSRIAAEAAALIDRWAGRLASRPVLWARAQARALMGDAPGARADLDEAARLRAALGLPADSDELWAEPPVALGCRGPPRGGGGVPGGARAAPR